MERRIHNQEKLDQELPRAICFDIRESTTPCCDVGRVSVPVPKKLGRRWSRRSTSHGKRFCGIRAGETRIMKTNVDRGKSPGERAYYSSSQRKVAFFGLVFFGLLILDEGIRSRTAISLLFAILLGCGCSVVFLRLALARIAASEQGIRVTNIFSSVELTWDEISYFSIGRWQLLPYVCLIHLNNGGLCHATGIEENTNFANGSAEEIVRELNEELARRRPDGFEPDGHGGTGPGAAQSELFRHPGS